MSRCCLLVDVLRSLIAVLCLNWSLFTFYLWNVFLLLMLDLLDGHVVLIFALVGDIIFIVVQRQIQQPLHKRRLYFFAANSEQGSLSLSVNFNLPVKLLSWINREMVDLLIYFLVKLLQSLLNIVLGFTQVQFL